MTFMVSKLVRLFTVKNTELTKATPTYSRARKLGFPSSASCPSWLLSLYGSSWFKSLFLP